jgi:hypothetical protein
MYVCVLVSNGRTKVYQNLETNPELLFDIISLFIEDVVVCVEYVLSGAGSLTFVLNTKFPSFWDMLCT